MKADKSNFYCYNKRLQPFANKLRREMTRAEACLWKYAPRARQMKGRQFRRQRPVLNYIADFMCKELKLIIEVDGITHDLEATAIKDKKKTRDLQRAGFVVLRFWDDDVLSNMQGVIRRIEHTIDEIEAHPLAPPQAGDRPPPTPMEPPPQAGDRPPPAPSEPPPPAGDIKLSAMGRDSHRPQKLSPAGGGGSTEGRDGGGDRRHL